MVPSHTIGELALIRLVMTVFSSTKSAPNSDLRHIDRVCGALRLGDRAHERLIGIA